MDTLRDPSFLRQEIVGALQCSRPACPCIKGKIVHCPAHDDTKPSLTVSVRNGSLLVHCHAGCTQEATIEALRARGLWLALGNRPQQPDRQRHGRIAATHDYRDETGALLFQVIRKDPKGFKQRRPDGRGGWIWNLDGVRRVLYRLPELLAAPADAVVYVVEGEKDADRIVATGLVATTNPGGAGKWSPAFNETLRGRHAVILPDNDVAGRAHSQQVAQTLHGVAALVKVVELPGLPEKGDVSDWLDANGTRNALEALAMQAPEWTPPAAPGLAQLLAAVEAFVRQYVVLTSSELVAATLWVLHDWSIEAFDVTPYLAVTSPEKRAGKTRLLEVLELLLQKPLRVANISEAALFRSIADTTGGRAVILLDEADAVFHSKGNHEDLRALLNAGYRRGAVVARCDPEGRSYRVRQYDAFGAKVIASIGDLPDTIADRSIPIRMQRRARHEAVARFRLRKARIEAAKIRDALRAWTTPGVVETLRAAWPEIPLDLDDRSADGWEPLFAIADLASGGWPQRARQAALELHDAQGVVESTRILLLHHIFEAFEQAGAGFIPTTELLKGLVNREDGPWAAWWANEVEAGRTKGPAAKLAALLRPFGITPTKQRVGEETPRGYDRAAFAPVWQRWLPSLPTATPKTEQSEQTSLDAGFGDFESRNTRGSVPSSELGENPHQMRVVASVPSSPPPVDGEAESGVISPPAPLPGTPTDFDCQAGRAREPFYSEVVHGDSPVAEGEQPRCALPSFGDCDRRAVVVRMGETLGWPDYEFKPGVSVAEGEEHWRTFAATASGEDITLVLQALEASGGPGDG